MTFGGRDAIALPNGETRRYLQDGDEVTFRAHCRRPGAVTIGFGEWKIGTGVLSTLALQDVIFQGQDSGVALQLQSPAQTVVRARVPGYLD